MQLVKDIVVWSSLTPGVASADVARDVAKTTGTDFPFSNPPPIPPVELPLKVQLASVIVPPKLPIPPP